MQMRQGIPLRLHIAKQLMKGWNNMNRYLIDDLLDEGSVFPLFFSRGYPRVGDFPVDEEPDTEEKADTQAEESSRFINIDLHDFPKDQIILSLENGFLTIKAERNQDRDRKDENGRTIYQQHFADSRQCSFYVGTGLKGEEVRAKFTDGVLKLEFPKRADTPEAAPKQIPITD